MKCHLVALERTVLFRKKGKNIPTEQNPLTEQSCLTKKLGIIWVCNRKVNKLLTEVLLFHNSLCKSIIHSTALNLHKKVSVANFISEPLYQWYAFVGGFFFLFRILNYSKPELQNLTHCLLRCYSSLTVFSPLTS